MSEKIKPQPKPSDYQKVRRIMSGLNLSEQILDMEDDTQMSFRTRIGTKREEDGIGLYSGFPQVIAEHILGEIVEGKVSFNPADFEGDARRAQQETERVQAEVRETLLRHEVQNQPALT